MSLSLLGIAAAPLVLAGIGVTHPHTLTAETASYWLTLHLVLLPLFPLLGVNLWWLLAGVPGPLAWLARALAFVYIPFYGALDVLAGVATGLVVTRAEQAGQPGLLEVNPWLFGEGNALAEVGVWAFLLACVLTSALLIRRAGRAAVPGALLLVGAAISFLNSHIYYPVGVVTMLAMAGGFAGLQWARLSSVSPAAVPADEQPAALGTGMGS
jgi:hypothetical protein